MPWTSGEIDQISAFCRETCFLDHASIGRRSRQVGEKLPAGRSQADECAVSADLHSWEGRPVFHIDKIFDGEECWFVARSDRGEYAGDSNSLSQVISELELLPSFDEHALVWLLNTPEEAVGSPVALFDRLVGAKPTLH